jgi:hypothetical protein
LSKAPSMSQKTPSAYGYPSKFGAIWRRNIIFKISSYELVYVVAILQEVFVYE